MAMMKGIADKDAMMEQMMAAPPEAEETEDTGPKALVDQAIARVQAYVENPEQVTPQTVQELLTMLQQASDMLGAD